MGWEATPDRGVYEAWQQPAKAARRQSDSLPFACVRVLRYHGSNLRGSPRRPTLRRPDPNCRRGACRALELEQGAGSIINVSMNYATMKRRGFSPYGPSKAALESATIIWAQDLEGSGITVNALLPGGATATGMVPDGRAAGLRARLLRPEICGPPAVYLASDAARHLTGRRLVATEWTPEQPEGSLAADGLGILPAAR
ncbi:MAG: SDR family oxidoreductase [Dehalococcoidia bacterium]